MMGTAEVLEVLEVLSAAEIPVWLDGGSGIDALVGEQTAQRLAGAPGRRLSPPPG